MDINFIYSSLYENALSHGEEKDGKESQGTRTSLEKGRGGD